MLHSVCKIWKILILLKKKDLAEFGYRQAFSGAIKALGNRQKTGQTIGQIGSKFVRKIGLASKGKLASVGRLGNRVKRTITGNTSTGIKLSINQQSRAVKNIGAAGGRKLTKSGSFTPVSVNPNFKPPTVKNANR